MRDDIFCLIFWCYVPLGYLSPISGLSQVNVRKIWSKYQENIRHISGKFPIYLRLTKGINSAYLKHISSISQANSRLVFTYLRQISGIFKTYLRHVSVSPNIFLSLSVYTHQLVPRTVFCQAQPNPQLSWAEWLYVHLIHPTTRESLFPSCR